MPEILLVKRAEVPESRGAELRSLLFESLDGLGELNAKRWRRFWNWIASSEVGECFAITVKSNRVGWYHRKHMALEHGVFDAQDRFEDFVQFRHWLKIGAGHVRWVPGPKGGIVPVPLSIDYASLDQLAMQEFHDKVVAFLRTELACKALWPKLSPTASDAIINSILEGFGE